MCLSWPKSLVNYPKKLAKTFTLRCSLLTSRDLQLVPRVTQNDVQSDTGGNGAVKPRFHYADFATKSWTKLATKCRRLCRRLFPCIVTN